MAHKKIEDLRAWDVAVCGGGMAGVAAAVAARRMGLETVLIERWPFLGGLGTAAYVTGLHTSDREKQVIFGITQEIIERADRYGAVWHIEGFPKETHLACWYDAEWMKIVLDELAREVGFAVLLYTPVVDVRRAEGGIEAVIVGTPKGLRAIRARVFVDATGDADLAAWAGCPTATGRERDGRVQGMTLMYHLTGLDHEALWAMTHDEVADVQRRMAEARDRGELPSFGALGLRAYGRKEFNPNMCPVTADPLDPLSLSEATMRGRLNVARFIRWWRRHVAQLRTCDLGAINAVGVRESRRIQGEYVFSREDVYGLRKFPDAIGHGFWMVDIHDPEGSGATTWSDRANWLPAGETYHIPYRVMLPEGADNLFVVGRCASTTHEGLAALRIQSHCMVMGQAAGTAAALALDAGCSIREVPMARLQATLRGQGVYLEDVPQMPSTG